MKFFKVFLMLMIVSSSYSQSRVKEMVKKRTDDLEVALSLNKIEKSEVYAIFLEKETKISELRSEHVGDRKTLNAQIKKLHPIYNAKLREVLGKERMGQMFAYFRKLNNRQTSAEKTKSGVPKQETKEADMNQWLQFFE